MHLYFETRRLGTEEPIWYTAYRLCIILGSTKQNQAKHLLMQQESCMKYFPQTRFSSNPC